MCIHCPNCKITACPLCAIFYLKIAIPKELILQPYQSKENLIQELIKYSDHLVEENKRLKEQIQRLQTELLEETRQRLVLHDLQKHENTTAEEAQDKKIRNYHKYCNKGIKTGVKKKFLFKFMFIFELI